MSKPQGVAVLADGGLAVSNYTGDSITVYAAAASGDATPTRTISGGSTGLNGPFGVAALADGALAVGNYLGDSVTVYGTPAPPAPTSIPTLSEWGMILLGLALLAVVGWRQRQGYSQRG